MPKFSELLRPNVNNSSNPGDLTCIKLALAIKVDTQTAARLLSQYGRGYIYTRSGLVLSDTPRARYRVASAFGRAIVVDVDGCLYEINKQHACKLLHNPKRKRDTERNALYKAIAAHEQQRQREHLFMDGQTQPTPKRGGKGKSLANLGAFVPRRRTSVYDVEPQSVTRFQRITIA